MAIYLAGVATGILYWGTIEWAYYIDTPLIRSKYKPPGGICIFL